MSAELQPDLPARLSTEEYLRRGIAGEWDHLGRIELIDGEIRQMSPIGPSHANVVSRLIRLLPSVLPEQDFAIYSQSTQPVPGGHAPEPDFVVSAAAPALEPQDRHPRPEEIFLIIEVADSSLSFDRSEKMELYASLRIPEYWIVNLRDRVLEVHRDPDPEAARYDTVVVAGVEDEVRPHFAPRVRVAVRDIFKPKLGAPP